MAILLSNYFPSLSISYLTVRLYLYRHDMCEWIWINALILRIGLKFCIPADLCVQRRDKMTSCLEPTCKIEKVT